MRALVFLSIAVALGACGSNARNDAPAEPEVADSEQEPWFCQVGQDDESWDCIRSTELSDNPRPERLPSAVTEPAAEPEPDEPLRASDPVTALAAVPPPQLEPTPAPIPRSAPAGPRVAETNVQPATKPANAPRYQELAYQPDRPTSLLELPADFWAAQLIAMSSKEGLENYAAEHQLSGMSAARVAIADNLFYVLLLGIYETREIAEEAIAELPPPFDRNKPWLRTMESLQKAMLAGDRIAGTTEL